MIVNDIEFNDSLKVLYRIKQKRNHKTLQETLKYLDTQDIEVMLDVILESYNAAHPGAELDDDGLGDLLAEHGIGLAKIAMIYAQVVEKLTYSGMSDDEVTKLKNQIANLKK